MRIVKIHKFFITLFAAITLAITPSISFATLDSTYKFEMNISGVQNFGFKIVATGTFYVDCGDNANMYGGPGITVTPQGSGKFLIEQTVGAVERTSNSFNHVCVFTGNTSNRTVSIGGSATAFSDLYPSFQVSINPNALTSISGDLTAVFPKVGSTYPSFAEAFQGCTNLKWIPGSTFYGLSKTNSVNNNSNPNGVIMTNVFAGTSPQGECPSGYANVTQSYYSGYSGDWNGMLACEASAPVIYTITLDDGTGVTASGETVSGSNKFYESSVGGFYSDSGVIDTFTQMENIPVKAPYTFNGYWTGQNGSGTQVINSTGAPVTGVSLGADTTIYADWILVTPFSVTTTNLSSDDVFKFKIGAGGTFYVDCGTDGTLYDGETNTSIPNGFFTKYHNSWWTEHLYYCSYTTGGVKQIGFGGIADSYPSLDDACASIRFGKRFNSEVNNGSGGWEDDVTAEKLAGISGSLGAVFPTIDEKQGPAFFQTFQGCSNLTGTIPSNLFTGATLAHPHMFEATFEGCYGLTGAIPTGLFDIVSGEGDAVFCRTFYDCRGLTGSIPTGLFGGVSGNGIRMFENTFHGCSGLTGAIPSGLFSGVTGNANQLFRSTFEGCSGLTGAIPTGLFGNVSGSGEYMFENTFKGCSGLTGAIPSGLFSGVTGTETHLFNGTFEGCAGLTGTIPSGLFGNVSGTAMEAMFSHTFKGCSNLSGLIPSDLFGSVTGYADWLFSSTFENCSSLTGAIPSDLFGRNVNGSYVGVSGAAIGMFNSTFSGCGGLTGAIPSDLFGRVVNNTYYGVSGYAEELFQATFMGCTSLGRDSINGTPTYGIPSGLFDRVSGHAPKMFQATFAFCTGLNGSIPSGLFDNISGADESMFLGTFGGCSSLSGPLPSDLFDGVSGSADNMFLATFAFCERLGQDYENGQWVSKYNIPGGIFGSSVDAASNSNMFDLAFYNTGFLECCASGARQITTTDNNVARFVNNWSGVGGYQQMAEAVCSEYGITCPQGQQTRKVACITGEPAVGESTWVGGACVEDCGKKLNVKLGNAVQPKEYSMYKRNGTLIGDKTLNIKELGATDTCYVPFSSTEPASINNNGIQGILAIKVNGTTYYAEPSN